MAVKTITDGWPLEVIPLAYRSPTLAPAQPTVAQRQPEAPSQKTSFSSTLPSPVTPSTSPTSCMPGSPAMPNGINECMKQSHATQLRSFVTEVVRRSKTSGCVLQAAACYLEGLKASVPELARKEALGIRDDVESQDRIIIETCPPSNDDDAQAQEDNEPTDAETVRLTDDMSIDISEPIPTPPAVSAEYQLPCPLLCPRRAFLASLILASKFLQDKSYSNRAWAKLSGLPAKEISRCERGLGRALDWRLWVGRTSENSPSPAAAAAPVPAKRSLGRSSSEGAIFSPPSSSFLGEPAGHLAAAGSSVKLSRSLARCASAPVNAFMGDQMVSDLSGTPSEIHFAPIVTDMDSSHHETAMDAGTAPPTPGLTYSPSSSESSLGDRTIQMSTFTDPGSDCWSWPDAPDGCAPQSAPLGKLSLLDKSSFPGPAIAIAGESAELRGLPVWEPPLIHPFKVAAIQQFESLYTSGVAQVQTDGPHAAFHERHSLHEVPPV
ncbi:hypothetical protein DL96DRAFT_1158818 [Flagelloscypha sp. PMI_526]|nr:hypothetical protein DL96DRAFT_1158818 [Flagelloscypha sp. PMI_526]